MTGLPGQKVAPSVSFDGNAFCLDSQNLQALKAHNHSSLILC